MSVELQRMAARHVYEVELMSSERLVQGVYMNVPRLSTLEGGFRSPALVELIYPKLLDISI
jgi:hypothetical protein